MAGVRISALPSQTTPLLTDVIPAVQSGVTYQEALLSIMLLYGANIQIASPSQITGLGTAAEKTASDNSKINLSSVNLPTIIGHIATFYDINGSIQDGGSVSQFLLAANNLSDIPSPSTARTNLGLGPSSIFNWIHVTATSQILSSNTGYVTDNSSLVTLTLPITANFGDIIEVSGKGTGGWSIKQNSGQIIHFLSIDTTSGASGSLSSTNRYDSIELLCIVANTEFSVISSTGNISII